MALNIVALIPAYNEADSIAATIGALLVQERIPDKIIVIPNGCTDDTAEIARSFPTITVLELPKLKHKKSEALNIGWGTYGRDVDLVVCLDADTVLPSNAVKDWEEEFIDPTSVYPSKGRRKGGCEFKLGGSSSKFTMRGTNFWTTLQRSEFAMWTDTGLRRGYTSVLAGTGCAISGEALREVVATTGRPGPWAYTSQVEDFELTYQLRKLGWRCWISPTVRAYTDSMKTLRTLWSQRMKWQVGTVEDLLSLGINRLTFLDWRQQIAGVLLAMVRILWIALLTLQIVLGLFQFTVLWVLAVPITFAFGQLMMTVRIPHASRRDYFYAASLIPSEIFAWVRTAWFLKAWQEVLFSKCFKTRRKDRWQLQHSAEAK